VLEGKLLPDQLKGRTIVVGQSRNVALGTLAVLWYVATESPRDSWRLIGLSQAATVVA
jgi:hypothetical protein